MKRFDHKRPVRDAHGNVTGHIHAPVFRMTRGTLGGSFGIDKNHPLVVGLEAGDVISFRPAKTRRKITAPAVELYRAVLQWQVNKANLERARARKAALAEQRERRRIARVDARLRREASNIE